MQFSKQLLNNGNEVKDDGYTTGGNFVKQSICTHDMYHLYLLPSKRTCTYNLE